MIAEDRRAFMARLGTGAIVGGAVVTLGQAQERTPELKKEIVAGSTSPAYSRAVRCGGWVYVSGVLGQVPGSRDLAAPEFEGQARQALENLKAAVEAGGSKLERVVKCTAFLTEASDFAAFNEIYMKYFPTEPPARSTVIVKALVAAGAKIEIDCIAAA